MGQKRFFFRFGKAYYFKGDVNCLRVLPVEAWLMNPDDTNSAHRSTVLRGSRAAVYLEGRAVGTVDVTGWDTSWGFGTFHPNETFAEYASLFGSWSLLMHADGENSRLSAAASTELAMLESSLDSLKAMLEFQHDGAQVHVAQLTIDGDLLEWKEY